MNTRTDPELLQGYDNIGRFLGLTARQVKHRVEAPTPGAPRIPTFQLGRRVAARPESLRNWLRECEAHALGQVVQGAACEPR